MKLTLKNLGISLWLALAVFLFIAISNVNAAALTYSDDTTVSLSSPAVTFTIKGGSTAEGVYVYATSVDVTMSTSSSNTETFTLTSASRDFSVVSTGTGGSVREKTCSSAGLATVVIQQTGGSSTYTIAPDSGACIPPATGAGSVFTVQNVNSGGGGTTPTPVAAPVETPTTAPVTPAKTENTASVQSLKKQIADLQTMLLVLIQKAKTMGLQVPSSANTLTSGGVYNFTKNLTVGSVGDDVRSLQNFLIQQNKGPAGQSLSDNGSSGYFGNMTKAALAEYQESMGITPSVGYFGPKTRNQINSLSQ